MNKKHRVSRKLLAELLMIGNLLISCKKDSFSQATTRQITVYETTPDQTRLLSRQPDISFSSNLEAASNIINVDESKTYQTIEGFGFDLTDASALVINRMPVAQQDDLLKTIFAPTGDGIHSSYLRIAIGAESLSLRNFTYDEVNSGTDYDLNYFSLAPSMPNLIPILKKIVVINPSIKILASPFTPPTWMKSNGSFIGGTLKPTAYNVYAAYFVKYILAMQRLGVTIDAITPQNEPNNTTADPSMGFSALEETNFIANNLGPAFKQAGLVTKIICYDHNCDDPSYPKKILSNANASSFVDGSAFHFYAGPITALSEVHNAFPNKNIYFTEQYTSSTGTFAGYLKSQTSNLIIGATRNWARAVIGWTLAADAENGPHKSDGCPNCLPAITIAQTITKNIQYYVFAHASKFVRPGAVRIGSSMTGDLRTVAVKNEDNSKVLIILNSGVSKENFKVVWQGLSARYTLPAGAVATLKWY